jgi:hypothetical protein
MINSPATLLKPVPVNHFCAHSDLVVAEVQSLPGILKTNSNTTARGTSAKSQMMSAHPSIQGHSTAPSV